MLKLSLSGARKPHVNRDIGFFLEPQIETEFCPKPVIKKSLGKSSHSKHSHCCLTISRCSMVTGFISQYKWLLKLLKRQIIIVMICETVSKEHQEERLDSFLHSSGYAQYVRVSRNIHLILFF